MKSEAATDCSDVHVHDVVVRVCQNCIDLVGQECHEPACVFCFKGMDEAKWLLDKMLICPIIDGERYVLAGDAVEEFAAPTTSVSAEVRGWQPIETCPLGTQVLLLWQGGTPKPHYEIVIGTIPVTSEFTRNQWWNGQRGDYESMDRIVGWQPLPSPPTESLTDSKESK